MIRSSKITFKWTNRAKRDRLELFLSNYRSVLRDFVDILWELDKFPALLPKEVTSTVDPRGLSARAMQAAAKQAAGVVKGTRTKNRRRLYVLEKLRTAGDTKGAERLGRAIASNPGGKPDCSTVCPELDSRFCSIDLEPGTSFQMWVTLGSLGKPYGKIELPFNRTRHFNKMLDRGEVKKGVRLSSKGVTFMFDIPDPPKRELGTTLGVDIGQRAVLSTSSGFQTGANKHGHDLASITRILSRRRRGSKGFLRAQAHRDNYVNWSINQLDLSGVRQVNRENIKDMRRGKNSGRGLSHWTYPAIIDKLESRCLELGVLVRTVDPVYTSQRCHQCGFTRKGNRKGVMFKCGACGHATDSDLNAALNISLDLPSMREDRWRKLNRTGFYWAASGQELIVPVVTRPGDI
jgi:hypothetical protein